MIISSDQFYDKQIIQNQIKQNDNQNPPEELSPDSLGCRGHINCSLPWAGSPCCLPGLNDNPWFFLHHTNYKQALHRHKLDLVIWIGDSTQVFFRVFLHTTCESAKIFWLFTTQSPSHSSWVPNTAKQSMCLALWPSATALISKHLREASAACGTLSWGFALGGGNNIFSEHRHITISMNSLCTLQKVDLVISCNRNDLQTIRERDERGGSKQKIFNFQNQFVPLYPD